MNTCRIVLLFQYVNFCGLELEQSIMKFNIIINLNLI